MRILLRIAGIALLTLSGLMLVWAAYIYVRDDIPAVRADLAGRRRVSADAPRPSSRASLARRPPKTDAPGAPAATDGRASPEPLPAYTEAADGLPTTRAGAEYEAPTAEPLVEVPPSVETEVAIRTTVVPEDGGSTETAFRLVRRLLAVPASDLSVIEPWGEAWGTQIDTVNDTWEDTVGRGRASPATV